jgi:hypothetical protein
MKKHNASLPEKTVLGVHRGIFMLGMVSILTDLSSEMIFSVFSMFLTVILGASVALRGPRYAGGDTGISTLVAQGQGHAGSSDSRDCTDSRSNVLPSRVDWIPRFPPRPTCTASA